MDFESLKQYLNEHADIKKVKESGEGKKSFLSFVYKGLDCKFIYYIADNILLLEISTNFKEKLFAHNKIKDAYFKWVDKTINVPEDNYEHVTFVTVGSSNVFVSFYFFDLVFRLPAVLDSFKNEFLPSISSFIK